MVWPEVNKASSQGRYELVLSGREINARLENEKQLDPTIWSLVKLNFLEITDLPLLESLPSDLGRLVNLATLTLTGNNLRQLPDEMRSLHHLRHVNVSHNQLSQLPDDLFSQWTDLETLNLSNNQLTQIPPFSPTNNLKLAVINVSHNRLESIGDFPVQLDNLSQIDLSSNLFSEVPNSLCELLALKVLNLDSNQLQQIPSQLSQCPKLKELRFQSNPLKDNRLKKLMEQEKIKPVLDYLARQWTEEQKTTSNAPKSVVSKQQKKKNATSTSEESVVDQIEILHFDHPGELKGRQITLLPRVIAVRPHILCCIVRQLDFATDDNLKKFVALQNELDDELCQKRTLATIGTHDLSLIAGNLVYDARDPDEIGFVPLGRGSKLVSARDFYDQLYRDAERERKAKKRNQLSGLHKYLSLLNDQSHFPCLADSDRHVISLPPLTNAERSKLSTSTESILIEVTSSHSLDTCRRVLEGVLRAMLKLNLGKKSDQPTIRQILILQQTRVVDDKGQLKNTFPSRTDLDWNEPSIVIQRSV